MQFFFFQPKGNDYAVPTLVLRYLNLPHDEMFPPLLDEKYSAIFQDCGEWNGVQGYNKATDPLVRRGAMALYRMMCWAPFSMSIGSSSGSIITCS